MTEINPIDYDFPASSDKGVLIVEREALLKQLKARDQRIAQLEAAWNGAGGWISVEDELPDDYELKLVTNGAIHGIAYYHSNGNSWQYQTQTIFNVTHWRPLPAPPERK